jgi:hypothetical protein
MSAIAQDLGLDPEQIGLNGGGATQTPQQRCQPKHQLALYCGPGVTISDDEGYKSFVDLNFLEVSTLVSGTARSALRRDQP